MAYETKPNTGALFKNEEKLKDTHADYRGTAIILCPHCNRKLGFFMDAWIKTVKDGTKKWMSFAFKLKSQEYREKSQPAPKDNNKPAAHKPPPPPPSNRNPQDLNTDGDEQPF